MGKKSRRGKTRTTSNSIDSSTVDNTGSAKASVGMDDAHSLEGDKSFESYGSVTDIPKHLTESERRRQVEAIVAQELAKRKADDAKRVNATPKTKNTTNQTNDDRENVGDDKHAGALPTVVTTTTSATTSAAPTNGSSNNSNENVDRTNTTPSTVPAANEPGQARGLDLNKPAPSEAASQQKDCFAQCIIS